MELHYGIYACSVNAMNVQLIKISFNVELFEFLKSVQSMTNWTNNKSNVEI